MKHTAASHPHLARPCNLKHWYEILQPDEPFFLPEQMRCHGDTMANFGLRQPRPLVVDGQTVLAYELARMRPTPRGWTRSNWFHAETLKVLKPDFEKQNNTPNTATP